MAKIKFDIPAEEDKPSSINFKLQKSEIELFENYTKFLCDKHKTKVEKEVILRGLIKPLFKDKEYLKFLNKDSERVGAVSEKKENIKKPSLKADAETKVESASV